MENTDNKFFTKTFLWMFLGLLGTAIVATYTYYSGLCYKLALNNGFIVVSLIELVAVLIFSFLFKKMSPTVAAIVYFLYSFLNGVSLSSIFAAYNLESIAIIFVATSLVFGILAFIGFYTKKDLSNWRTILFVTLLVGIGVSILNLFLRNSTLYLFLSWAMLILFFGITIYDMNKLKQLSQDPEMDSEKIHIYGALELYLDFINIFIRLLYLFGKSRD